MTFVKASKIVPLSTFSQFPYQLFLSVPLSTFSIRHKNCSRLSLTMSNAERKQFYSDFLKSVQDTIPKPPPLVDLHSPKKFLDLIPTIQSLSANMKFLREENSQLKDVVNHLLFENSQLKSDLDALDQYSRRENVCFTNVKVDEDNACTNQIVKLCQELEVDVATSDLVAAHPLPTKKPRSGSTGNTAPKRFIARFKDRSTAQSVLSNRKLSKNISPQSKNNLFSDPNRGIAVQPNITPLRTSLLAQVKDAVRECNLEGCWVDTKNCNIMLRCVKNGRPVPIFNTVDLCCRVRNFQPKEFILCANPVMVRAVPPTAPSQSGSH